MRPMLSGLLLLIIGFSSGCGLAQMGKDTARMFTPSTGGYGDGDIDDGKMTDEWSIAGKEGRGDQPMEREADGLTKYVSSSKARRIGRNLGVDSP